MHNNIFIIGNGFDLDLGLPTKYSDFANSEFWPKAKKQIKQNRVNYHHNNDSGLKTISISLPEPILLENHLDKKRKLDNWFDIENEILEYSKKEEKRPNYNHSDDVISQNNSYYLQLQNNLCDYILNIQNTAKINHDSVAYNVIKLIINNGFFNQIYSFNYTNIKKIIPEFNNTPDIIHIHGKVDDNSIILGVDETPLKKGYECFHKSSSKYYSSHNLYKDITNADEIVMFGLSFGRIDYSYFYNYFYNLSQIKDTPNDKKQNITIFTKDDNSRLDIISKLREMQINIQNLYAQSNFQIICTNDGLDSPKLCEFKNRITNNSISNYFIPLIANN